MPPPSSNHQEHEDQADPTPLTPSAAPQQLQSTPHTPKKCCPRPQLGSQHPQANPHPQQTPQSTPQEPPACSPQRHSTPQPRQSRPQPPKRPPMEVHSSCQPGSYPPLAESGETKQAGDGLNQVAGKEIGNGKGCPAASMPIRAEPPQIYQRPSSIIGIVERAATWLQMKRKICGGIVAGARAECGVGSFKLDLAR
ncbi:hypothetical protein Dimus_003018 [Dionaea muscipula]